MFQVEQITDNTLQQQNLVLPDGSVISLTLVYLPQQYGWFIQSLSYGSFLLQGTRITVSPDILYQFRNQLPFGLSCQPAVDISREPTQQQDFSSGAFSLFVLTAEEVQQYRDFLNGEI